MQGVKTRLKGKGRFGAFCRGPKINGFGKGYGSKGLASTGREDTRLNQ